MLCRNLLNLNPDLIYDIDEADPWNSTTPSVVAFRNLYGHNNTLMNNSFQQFVRDEMVPIIRKFDARTDGEVVCDPLLGWVCWPVAVAKPGIRRMTLRKNKRHGSSHSNRFISVPQSRAWTTYVELHVRNEHATR